MENPKQPKLDNCILAILDMPSNRGMYECINITKKGRKLERICAIVG